MSGYLLIESRDPFECADTKYLVDLAQSLAKEKNEVTLFLVQNGVLPARSCAASASLAALSKAGVSVLADEFSLRERGIATGELAAAVKPVALDAVVDQMVAGAKVLWN